MRTAVSCLTLFLARTRSISSKHSSKGAWIEGWDQLLEEAALVRSAWCPPCSSRLAWACYSLLVLGERLARRMRHLAKWARKQGIGCFRLYERDIPDYPIVIDWYADQDGADLARDGDAVAWFHDRKKDETPEEAIVYCHAAEAEIISGLGIPRERLFVKSRGRQRNEEGQRQQYERLDSRGVVKVVAEHGSRFEVNLSDYLDVGLFLDHRPTRLAVRERAQGRRVLNLFAYTGAFSVHARAGGAARTSTLR